MKKLWRVLILVTMMMVIMLPQVNADIPLRVVLDGDEINFPDAKPFIDGNNRTQTPARFIGEALGATVSWNGATREATFVKGGQTLVLTIDSRDYKLNGNNLTMDTEAIIANDRTFVPARYIAEAFGADVGWDGSVKTVLITSNADTTPLGDGEVGVYDGIEFDTGKDITIYGEISKEKSIEMCLNFLDKVSFKEVDGVKYIEGTYPELPEGYHWKAMFQVYPMNTGVYTYSSTTKYEPCIIASEGHFLVESIVQDSEEVDFLRVIIAIEEDDDNGSIGRLVADSYKDNNGDAAKCDFFMTFTADGENEDLTTQASLDRLFQWD